jgi:hypothetical protein
MYAGNAMAEGGAAGLVERDDEDDDSEGEGAAAAAGAEEHKGDEGTCV